MLLEHDVLGQRARFERFAADMLYILAAGEHIDANRAERFSVQVDRIYASPFAKAGKQENEMSAEEIRQYIIKRLGG